MSSFNVGSPYGVLESLGHLNGAVVYPIKVKEASSAVMSLEGS